MDAPMSLSAAMVAEWDHETANTRRMLERVPWDRCAWRPHAKSYSMEQLARHLAHLVGWPAGILESDALDLASPAAAAMVPPQPHSTADLLASFERNAAASRAAMAGATPHALGQMWTLRHGARVILSLPRAAVIRSMAMNHAVHHRAQLGVYLRLNDLPVPGMYGPSADES